MKKYHLLFIALSPFALFACAKPSIDMPKSPFDDHYERIGMRGELAITDTMPQKDYNNIKKYLNDATSTDKGVYHYLRQEETRDLKYAYFGQESSTISQCLMSSTKEEAKRFSNNVSINESVNDQQIQSANSGIIKTSSSSTDYTFDNSYKTTIGYKYSHRLEKKNNDEPPVVTQDIDSKTYEETEADSIFGLSPYKKIQEHFITHTVREVPYEFKLLGDNNKAIYGMSGDKYLIKEGYSIFPDFKTTMGRTYKAEDNFFYEGLLEKYTDPANPETEKYHFTSFRFYHELLILSKAFDGTGVPILYLEKPVLIEYSEIKYDISYESLGKYENNIPDVTNPTNK